LAGWQGGRLCRQHRSPAIQVSVPGGCDRGVQGRGLALVGGLGTSGMNVPCVSQHGCERPGEGGDDAGAVGKVSPAGAAVMAGATGWPTDVAEGAGASVVTVCRAETATSRMVPG
jgi:hypothetical protein